MSGGHGHVIPRPDGVKARCGGPALCSVCAAELAQVREKETTAGALLSLAAELDSLASRPKLPSLSDEAYQYGSGIFQGLAEMVRQRATNGPGTPIFATPAPEDPDLTLVGLAPAQAYEAGAKAERERCALLAEEKRASYLVTGIAPDGHPSGWTQPFADLIREVPGDGS